MRRWQQVLAAVAALLVGAVAVAGPPGGVGNCFGGASGLRVVAGAEGITPPVFDPAIGKWIYFYNVADLGLEYTADCSRNSVDGCHFCEGIRV